MPNISFRVPDDIAEALEAGRITNHYPSQTEYVIALILGRAKRVSGLDQSRVQAAIMTDHRVGGAISTALVELRRSLQYPEISAPIKTCIDEAIEFLRFAQTVIMEAQIGRESAANKTADDRMRVRGGGDDWKQTERGG